MNINIHNQADLSNKYIRFTKWKLYRLQEKFSQVIYVEVFLRSEGRSPKTYFANIRLGIPGKDIIIKEKSKDLGLLFRNINQKMHQHLATKKKLNTEQKVGFSRSLNPSELKISQAGV